MELPCCQAFIHFFYFSALPCIPLKNYYVVVKNIFFYFVKSIKMEFQVADKNFALWSSFFLYCMLLERLEKHFFFRQNSVIDKFHFQRIRCIFHSITYFTHKVSKVIHKDWNSILNLWIASFNGSGVNYLDLIVFLKKSRFN